MKAKTTISYISIIALLIMLIWAQPPLRVHAAASGKIVDNVSCVRFRESPGGNQIKDANGNNIQLNGGQQLTVLDQSNSQWYKVSLNYNGVDYTGYVSSQYIVLDAENTAPEEQATTPSSDADFETKLNEQGFPESYKTMLRSIHEKYPYWEFRAVHTGIDWNTLVSKEVNRPGQVLNLVACFASNPHYNWRSTYVGYDYQYDKWSPFDGSNWYAASDALVTYYLDPRTYLYENYIFVFESLNYIEGVHNETCVEAILSGTFMSNAVPAGESETYAHIIMRAAQASGVSPYHIASRIRQEVGGGSQAAYGNNAKYPGIYNFYNIGANDTANGSAMEKGLRWASSGDSYDRPWNSPSKSIIGGAKWIGNSYINVGQNTLYTQKFNVTNKGNLFSHQYMTNVQAPSSEAKSCYEAYAKNNLLNSTMVFEIPVYENMPVQPVSKPLDSGNPNNYLKSLDISGYTLTPSFALNTTTDYSLIVPETTESITISATPVNAKASVSGTGTVQLAVGTNTLDIICTAEGGSTRTYKLTIVRGAATETVNNISGGGSTDNASYGGRGDLNGDGKISALDIVRMQRLIVGVDSMSDAALAAGDVNGDGKVSALDIVKIQRHIVGIETIQ